MTDFNEIIETNYHSYLIDIGIEQYFQTQIDNINKIDYSKLDSSRRLHRIKFIEAIKELTISIELD